MAEDMDEIKINNILGRRFSNIISFVVLSIPISIITFVLALAFIDILNGTPLLDIKPYIPEIDIHNVEKIGWLDNITSKIPETKSDNRFK